MKKTSVSKKVLAVVLALVTLMSFSVVSFAADTEKVAVEISSNGQDVVKGQVFDDYSAYVAIKKGATVDAGEVTASISMTNVASLGVEGTKSYSKTIKTGVEKKVNLDNYLPAFTAATVSGKIDGVAYGYDITAESNDSVYAILAEPQDKAQAQSAWKKLTSHLTIGTNGAGDDSYAYVPANAYVQIGTEKLSFVSAFMLDNVVQGSSLKENFKKAVKLEEVKELEDAQAEIYVPAGAILALSESVAVLNDAVRIKIYGYNDSADVNTILSKLLDCATTEDIILTLVTFISDAANAIDEQDIVVNVTFEKPPVPVASIVVIPEALSLVIGEEVYIEAKTLPANADDKTITWTSSDEYVAKVDKNGKVTATGAGEAVITATTSNGLKAECKVTVDVPNRGIFDLIITAISGWWVSFLSIFSAIVVAINTIFGI